MISCKQGLICILQTPWYYYCIISPICKAEPEPDPEADPVAEPERPEPNPEPDAEMLDPETNSEQL